MMRPALFGVCLAVVAACGCEPYRTVPLDAESLEKALTPPAADILRIRAENLNHPILRPIALDLGDGLSPDEAAVLAVVNSPDLRAARDERAIADAQVIEAGLLPNPQFSAAYDVVTFGETLGEFNAWSLGPSWEVTSLISRAAKVKAAAAHRKAVDLDIAWKEWQLAGADSR